MTARHRPEHRKRDGLRARCYLSESTVETVVLDECTGASERASPTCGVQEPWVVRMPMAASDSDRVYPDHELEDRIDKLHAAVKTWAEQNGLWQDAIFRRVVKHFDMTSGWPTVTTLLASGRLADIAIHPGMGAIHDTQEDQALSDECQRIVESHGFYGEPFTECRLDLIPWKNDDPVWCEQFREYMKWKWICSLVQGDFDALNTELYAYFGKNPDQLHRLHWRDFEKLVAELLESQGFATELGPGVGDGGVDIRLVQRDPLGDILTLVQAKRYAKHRQVELQAIQALHGAKTASGAHQSMFVTTSDYQPCGRRFASRENVRMDLYVSDDVQRWCQDATGGIVEDKRHITTEKEIIGALNRARDNPKMIVHASCGYTMRYNRFSLVLKESAGSALAMDVPSRIVQHDGYKQTGTEVPDLADDRAVLRAANTVRRLKKLRRDGSFRFSDLDEDLEFYTTWNQEPAEFYGD